MDTVPPPPPAAPAAAAEDKTVAIVGYLTLIGFIIAIIIHGNKKTKLGAYHLRQSLGLILTGFVASFLMIIPILGWIAAFILYIGLFVFWIMGLISAAGGQMKPVPLLGEQYQKWFGTAFD
ncbi:hypothetical protein DB347_00850 [Opitutaceae bacterium EW11]|nr:hypothetical protein DB347_00850 [Opitutaceae bacterium EW11]